MLVQVTTATACAGIIVERGICTEAAPILKRHCLGRTADELRALFKARGWKAIRVRPSPEAVKCRIWWRGNEMMRKWY